MYSAERRFPQKASMKRSVSSLAEGKPGTAGVLSAKVEALVTENRKFWLPPEGISTGVLAVPVSALAGVVVW